MITKEDILCYITQEEIFKRYLGYEIELNKKFRNPFRDDKNPDCSFYYNSNGTLYFVDFACKDCGGDCFNIVQLYYQCDFFTALRHINRDFKLGLYDGYAWEDEIIQREKVQTKEFKYIIKRRADIRYLWMEFTKQDLEYWSQFNISKEILDFFEVKAGFKAWINGWLYHTYSFKDPMYIYSFGEYSQIYRPFANKNKKWRTNTNNKCLHGLKQLPKEGKELIITSSGKDVMCLYSLGFNAIAPPSEGTIPDLLIIDDLKKRFTDIYVCFNNDKAGRLYTDKLCKIIPDIKGTIYTVNGKDPSEMLFNTDKTYVKNFIYRHFK